MHVSSSSSSSSSSPSSFFPQHGGGICLVDASEADCTGCHFADNSAPYGNDLYLYDSGSTFTASPCPPDDYTGTVDGTLDVAGANSGTYNSYTCTPSTAVCSDDNSTCNVCDACCVSFLTYQADCDGCVESKC